MPKDFKFSLEYQSQNKECKEDEFFEKEGHLPFDTHSKEETKIMMQEIANALRLEDIYSLKKLETTLRYELPFFATNRRLVRNWLMDNFIF